MSRVIAGFELILAFASVLFVVVGVNLFPEYQLILSLILIIYGVYSGELGNRAPWD